MVRKLAVCGVVVVVFSLLLAQEGEKEKPFLLTIIHVNDNHAHHEPDSVGDGGDSRQSAVIKQIRSNVKNHITLDAGDRFLGTLFYTKYKGLDNVPFLNQIGFQALAVGNHEFDEGDQGLANLADAIKCPVLAANLDVSKSKPLAGKIHPFTILTVAGEQIGIIGLVTADTKTGSRPSAEVTFDRDYPAVVEKYVELLTARKINKIVLLTHLGLAEDLKLAAQVSNVDVIVGGHSHTLLSKTYREAKNTYPMKVNDKDGNPVYIVQAGGGDNRYVGKLDLEFDAQGRVTRAGGDTILLSAYITPDPEIEAEVVKLAKPIEELKMKPILDRNGKPVTLEIELPAGKVREEETLLGDLFTDALRWKAKSQVALQGGGGLRDTLTRGPITVGDIYRVLPFTNNLCTYRLRGEDLRSALENGVSRINESGNGRFLQVSGMRYSYDPAQIKGQRIRSVDVQRADATWEVLDPARVYSIASDNYIRNGGDDFSILRDKAMDANEDLPPVQDIFVEYLQLKNPVDAKLEGRIRVVK